MNWFQLEQEGQPASTDPSPNEIESALRQTDARNRSFCILSRSDGSYVQIAGGQTELIAEFRQTEDLSFRHFVLGHHSDENQATTISCNIGEITLQENEKLQIDDAIKIFLWFMKFHNTLPEYQLREITMQF